MRFCDVKDAPWIGMGREEWEEHCSFYDQEYEDYLSQKCDDDWKAEKEEEL